MQARFITATACLPNILFLGQNHTPTLNDIRNWSLSAFEKPDLLQAKTKGTFSTTLQSNGIHYLSKLARVSSLVRSATRRAPWTPTKVLECKARYPSLPIRSHVIGIRSTVVPDLEILSFFIVTLLPMVEV